MDNVWSFGIAFVIFLVLLVVARLLKNVRIIFHKKIK